MKLFGKKLFSSSSKHHEGDKTVVSMKTDVSGLTQSSNSQRSKKSHGSRKSHHKGSKSKDEKVELPDEIWPAKPTKVKIAEDWIKSSNNHKNDELLAAFVSGKSHIFLEDGFSTNAQTFCDGMKSIYEAFPNFCFHYDSIQQESSDTVSIDGLVASGTHTGAPYTIDPERFPAIPATGKHVINDEERFVFKFTADNKIKSFQVLSFGNVTGPPGLYEQIGGKI